jgi:hypothetical protein
MVLTMAPSFKNKSETLIACSKSPPGFFRKSMSTPSIFPLFSFLYLSSAAFKSSEVVSIKLVIRTNKKPESRGVALIYFTLTWPRTILISKGLSSLSRTTVSVTASPFLPFNNAEASIKLKPFVDCPFIPTTLSPGFIPAL